MSKIILAAVPATRQLHTDHHAKYERHGMKGSTERLACPCEPVLGHLEVVHGGEDGGIDGHTVVRIREERGGTIEEEG